MMATMHDTVPTRKKVTTYGKAARRRIPEYSFSTAARKSQTPEAVKIAELEEATSTITVDTPRKLKSVPRRSSSGSLPSAAPSTNVFNIAITDDEAPEPIHRPIATPSKLKHRSTSSTPPSPPAKAADVFDIPTSDDEEPRRRTIPRPSKILPGKNAGSRHIKQKGQPSPPKPVPRTIPNVFDILSSDEEVRTLKPKPAALKLVGKSNMGHDPQRKTTLNTSTNGAEQAGSRKRLKPSPGPDLLSPRPVPVKTSTIPQRPKALAKPEANRFAKPLNGRLTSSIKGPSSKPAGRPEWRAPLKSPTNSTTPKKANTPESSPPSPQFGDIDMTDVDPEHEHISPKGMKMWKALLESTEDEDMTTEVHLPNLKPKRDEAIRNKPSSLLSRPAGIVKTSQRSPKKLLRRRLIDSLVEQAAQEESEDESSEDEYSQSSIDSGALSSQAVHESTLR